MNNTLDLFTSITANYLPKARVLATTAKAQSWPVRFHLLLSDDYPAQCDRGAEPFDSIISVDELGIPNVESWLFGHSLVEMCTAVKGRAFQEIARRYNATRILYFDPDIAIFSTLEPIAKVLEQFSIVLTPHQTQPESRLDAIIDNEICSLKHGVYNLGFLGVRMDEEGQRFIEWWSDRLHRFCHDDIAGGLFTDQRWIDLAPAFFESLKILRHPGCNVATWNLTHRQAEGDVDGGIRINGEPLCFYHFSGFDGGAQEVMLKKYAPPGSVLFKLRNWYIQQCAIHGQDKLGGLPCKYAYFDNNELISRAQRILYRSRIDLQKTYQNPFRTSGDSYYEWYARNARDQLTSDNEDSIRSQFYAAREELELIKRSRSWRISRKMARVWNAFR